jgi:hypothetical protein
MVRNARRSRILMVVVVALAGLMAAPIDECDDYALLNPRAVSAHAGLPDVAGEDTCGDSEDHTDHSQHCTCVVCDLAIDDSFAPSFPPPQRGDTVPPARAVALSSPHIPVIFHPPIA